MPGGHVGADGSGEAGALPAAASPSPKRKAATEVSSKNGAALAAPEFNFGAPLSELENPFQSVYFHFGDATLGSHLDFSHVYAFDRVFSPATLSALAQVRPAPLPALCYLDDFFRPLVLF
jgi:hypothetical protein